MISEVFQPVRVKPLRRYAQPGYPSLDEPAEAALARSEAALRRWTRPLIAPALWAAVAGSSALVGCGATTTPAEPERAEEEPSTQTAEEPTPTRAPEAPPRSSRRLAGGFVDLDYEPSEPYENPFTWELSGLPLIPIRYGTGLPNFLSEEQVWPVMERVFSEAGITLTSPVNYRRPGVAVQLDGYSSEHRVGYEFLTWMDIEADAPHREGYSPDEQASYDEVRQLMSMGQGEQGGDGDRILVVNQRDSRFLAGYSPQEAQEALERLEQSVRQYLLWLRSQGAL